MKELYWKKCCYKIFYNIPEFFNFSKLPLISINCSCINLLNSPIVCIGNLSILANN